MTGLVLATQTDDRSFTFMKRQLTSFLKSVPAVEEKPVAVVSFIGRNGDATMRKLFEEGLLKLIGTGNATIPSLVEAGEDHVVGVLAEEVQQSKLLLLLSTVNKEMGETFAAVAASTILMFDNTEKVDILQKLDSLEIKLKTDIDIVILKNGPGVQGSTEESAQDHFRIAYEKIKLAEEIRADGKPVTFSQLTCYLAGICDKVNDCYNSEKCEVKLPIKETCGTTPLPSPGDKVAEKEPFLAMVFSDQPTCGVAPPTGAVPFELQCPTRGCKSGKVYPWICCRKTCQAVLQYDFKGHVYCKCGRSNVTDLKFKCTDQEGVAFSVPDGELLTACLKQIQQPKQLNILILGETGVGKSTWINGFLNFLKYDSLDAAEEGPLNFLIPTHFTVCNENFEKIEVTTGSDKNEVQAAGQSATQSAKTYSFEVGKDTVNIIDTPGIGDTRGPAKDTENFDNILATLADIDELHGICILLKPNNARLNIMFRFCIQELLTHLHRDACRNIIFCFTNSRGTFYRPGDTLPALRELLDKNKSVQIPFCRDNVFCYDSEAYRFLAAIKNNPPVQFTKDERQNFSTSWTISAQETRRMLKYISTLQPHTIKNTLNLNCTRQLLLKLTGPLTELKTNIETNKKIMEDRLRELSQMVENIEEFKKKLMTKKFTWIRNITRHPKTVCHKNGCVKIWLSDGIAVRQHVQSCHDPCYLTGVPAGTLNCKALERCHAIKDSICTICGHSYQDHSHIYYDLIPAMEEVVDNTVKEAINRNQSSKQMKEEILRNQENILKEYEEESKQIDMSCAHFAQFLEMNAITPYNDALDGYYDHIIREEVEKVKQGGEEKNLKNYKKQKNQYLEKKRILRENLKKATAMPGDGNPIAPEKINDMINELGKLKHFGRDLQDALECAKGVKVLKNIVPAVQEANQFVEKAEAVAKVGKVGLELGKAVVSGIKNLF